MRKSKRAYREFLKSKFWKSLAFKVKQKAGRCGKCGSRKQLEAHHIRYPKDWFKTKSTDLVVLCRRCHAKEHGLRSSPDRPFLTYRNDILFSATVYRCEMLMNMVSKRKPLRPRDTMFLERAMLLFPPTTEDTCVHFKVNQVHKLHALFCATVQ